MKRPIYRVLWVENGITCELYAHKVTEGDLYGFIEIGDFIFPKGGSASHDHPLQKALSGVSRTHFPIASIKRIDVMESGELFDAA